MKIHKRVGNTAKTILYNKLYKMNNWPINVEMGQRPP